MTSNLQYWVRAIVPASWLLAALLAIAGCASTDGQDDGAAQASDEDGAEAMAEAEQQDAPANDESAGVDEEQLQPDHPTHYTVRRGDTLWDIAAKFLRDPWVWPEIWSVNPEITNPHLIYPGDVIRLVWTDDGKARLRAERPDAEPGVRKLEPKIRRMALDQAIDTIPAEAIRGFLNEPRVVSLEEMDNAPYLLAARDDRVLMSKGDEVFARGIDHQAFGQYMVFRQGEPLVDPETGDTLGWEAIHTGAAQVSEHGDPARVLLTSNELEIREGDRLLPVDDFIAPAEYIPKRPERKVNGQIIGLFNALTQVARNQIVVINRGTRDGMEVGTVLDIGRAGRTVEDPYSEDAGEEVELPSKDLGSMMVFRAFDRVSYGLILSSERPIRMHDAVTAP